MNRALLAFAVLIGSGHRGMAESRRANTLEMRWDDAETVHLAGDEGATNRRHASKVSIELLASGQVKGTDAGSSFEHNLYRAYSTDEETVWANAWTGAWAKKGGSLTLDLGLADRKCTRTKQSAGQPDETLQCDAITERIRLVCVTQQVRLENATDKPRRARTQVAWRCDPPDDANLGGTPRPWVFGKTTCLNVIGGHRFPLGYMACKSS
jgi:hypothetical protein